MHPIIQRLYRLIKPEPYVPLALRAQNQVFYIGERLRGQPLPPTSAIYLVAGTYHAGWFVEGGRRAAYSIRSTLARSYVDMSKMSRILDMGCGCGRVLREWRPLAEQSDVEICGTDYNPELVFWARRLIPYAQIDRNGLEPPLLYEANSFDLIYALSTFTHWTPDLQKAWVRELTRILKPGGFLLFTTHGEYYLNHLSPAQQEQFLAGRPVVFEEHLEGSNVCGAFHPFAYVASELRQELEIVQFRPQGAFGNPWQDVYLLRKPSGIA